MGQPRCGSRGRFGTCVHAQTLLAASIQTGAVGGDGLTVCVQGARTQLT